jgi:predicted component of type VI protein secretion system
MSSDTVKPMVQPALRHDPTAPGGPPADVLAAARLLRAPLRADATVPRGQPRPATARLLVTAGPSRGAEFSLIEPFATVGRARRNAVVIADVSVSRQHFRLEKRNGRWILLDSGSGNGTCVNRQQVRRRRLRHGDEIAIGDSVLRFLEPGGVIVWEPAGRTPPRLRCARGSLHAALAAAMILLVAASLVRRQRVAMDVEAEQRRASMHALARQKLQEGLSLIGEGRPDEGRARLSLAAELDGEDVEIARALQPPAGEAAPAVAAPVAAQATSAPGRAVATRHPRSPAKAPVEVRSDRSVTQSELDGRRALAERHLLAARDVALDDDLPRAAAHLRAALESDPQNEAARVDMERVAERVRELYVRSYVAKDADPETARAGFALVVRASSAGDELAAKAAHWLEKLDARGSR